MAKVEALLLFKVVTLLFVCNCLGVLSDERIMQIHQEEIDKVALKLAKEIFTNVYEAKIKDTDVDSKVNAILWSEEEAREVAKTKIFQNEATLNSKSGNLIDWTKQKMNGIKTDLEDSTGRFSDTFQSKCDSNERALISNLNSTEYEITTMITNSFTDFSANVKQQTKREHIAFTALLSVNADYSDFVCFDHVVVNHGNGYNKSSGLFTAPKDGVYLIISTFLVNGGYVNVELSMNGAMKGRGYASKDTYEGSGFVSSILKLVQGDKVGIKITEGYRTGYIRGDFYSSFTGTMIK